MNNLDTLQPVAKEAQNLTLFPVDLIPIVASKTYNFDAKGIPCFTGVLAYHPTIIAHYALLCWNDYCQTKNMRDRERFLAQVQWFVEHEIKIGAIAGGWPLAFPSPNGKDDRVWLSAITQGCAISLLARAYQLTHEQTLLAILQRTLSTFEQDILDGGVHTPIGEQGIFFEEVGVYPASHNLNGCIFTIICLYDYGFLMKHTSIEKLIERALVALHTFISEFDAGFWTYSDLLHRRLSSLTELSLHVKLLDALTKHTRCTHCALLIVQWKHYQTHALYRLRRSVSASWTNYRDTIWHSVQARLFPQHALSSPIRACIAVPAFPVLGGVLTVLEGIAHVTKDIWHIEYVTNSVGLQSENYVIHQFGTQKMGYWQFPMVWLHVIAGCCKFLALMHHNSKYDVILSQDGVFTGALAALTGKLAGVRVVCIDHGHLTLLNSKAYRAERIKILENRVWYRRQLSRFLYTFYWPSLSLLARIAGCLTDYFLVPGIAGDGVEEVCGRLGIPASRLVRFASMISIENHSVLDATARTERRASKNLPADAIVIAIICRLAPEKGLEVALESISIALSRSQSLKECVRVVIAGDGPLRQQLEDDVDRLGLRQTCVFWGDISQHEVFALLAISDIFLYTSIRGAYFPMAVLEAMAAGCAVIASTQPPSNADLLAEGRGIAIHAGNVEQTCLALTTLIQNLPHCRTMGALARAYIERYHSPEEFRRTLLRATYWSGLDTLLHPGKIL